MEYTKADVESAATQLESEAIRACEAGECDCQYCDACEQRGHAEDDCPGQCPSEPQTRLMLATIRAELHKYRRQAADRYDAGTAGERELILMTLAACGDFDAILDYCEAMRTFAHPY